ncbi:hypothetical protein B0H12DRAFT_101224 [Mycena haematopus]|nr:hypothetical protein B0H12DRAFT_101224 [Mycena haematopus]
MFSSKYICLSLLSTLGQTYAILFSPTRSSTASLSTLHPEAGRITPLAVQSSQSLHICICICINGVYSTIFWGSSDVAVVDAVGVTLPQLRKLSRVAYDWFLRTHKDDTQLRSYAPHSQGLVRTNTCSCSYSSIFAGLEVDSILNFPFKHWYPGSARMYNSNHPGIHGDLVNWGIASL